VINLVGPKIAEARRRVPMLLGVYGALMSLIHLSGRTIQFNHIQSKSNSCDDALALRGHVMPTMDIYIYLG